MLMIVLLKSSLKSTYRKIYNGPLSKANITSIITRGNCDPEIFEIVKQTIISNTSHYIINEMNYLLFWVKRMHKSNFRNPI